MNKSDIPPQKPEADEGEGKTTDDLIASLETDLRFGLTSDVPAASEYDLWDNDSIKDK